MKTKPYRVTKRDLEWFAESVYKYCDVFGLTNMNIAVVKRALPDGVIAQCVRVDTTIYNIACNLKLTFKPTRKKWDRYALHEVVHIILGELDHLANCRHTSEDVITDEVERVAQLLENVILGREVW